MGQQRVVVVPTAQEFFGVRDDLEERRNRERADVVERRRRMFLRLEFPLRARSGAKERRGDLRFDAHREGEAGPR